MIILDIPHSQTGSLETYQNCVTSGYPSFVSLQGRQSNRKLTKDGFINRREGGQSQNGLDENVGQMPVQWDKATKIAPTGRKRNNLPEIKERKTLLKTQTPLLHMPTFHSTADNLGYPLRSLMTAFWQFFNHYKMQGVRLLQIFERRHLHSDQGDSGSFDREK